MELTELLRQRGQQAKQMIQVECGGLGVLPVQALPLRECAALANGPDGDRALLYAACRQLQTAGEQLRRERRLFRPDEIMQLVSDEEARVGAEAVRRLSGLDACGSQTEQTSDGAAREERGSVPAPRSASDPEPVLSSRGGDQTGTVSLPDQAETYSPKDQKEGEQPGEIQPPVAQNPQLPEGAATVRPGREAEEVQLWSVRDVEKPAGETRQDPEWESKTGESPHEAGEENESTAARSGGAAGLEIQADAGGSVPAYEAALPDHQKKQERPNEPGGIPAATRLRSTAEDRPDAGNSKGPSVSPEGPQPQAAKPVVLALEEKPAHAEQLRSGRDRYEIQPELRRPLSAPETQWEAHDRPLPPVTEDLAREVARVIAEGLRRAAGAR